MALLEIKNLQLEFRTDHGYVRVLDGVSLSLQAGETLCLVGESGSGKSLTALSVAGLVPTPPARYVGGEVLLNGQNVLKLSPAELCRVRGGVVSYIFQEPAASLNPVFRVGAQIKEALRLHRPAEATDAEVKRLLGLVGIPAPENRIRDYPHQMSGGMQQRVMIAMAIATRPQLLIADEPTTALDVTIQAQILDLLRDLKQRLGMSILLITHNLGLVSELADRVAVMYAGQVVEEAPVRDLLMRPLHPYTRALMNSVPRLGGEHGRLLAIPGQVPAPGALPSGCRFHPRCAQAVAECATQTQVLQTVEGNRQVRCMRWEATP